MLWINHDILKIVKKFNPTQTSPLTPLLKRGEGKTRHHKTYLIFYNVRGMPPPLIEGRAGVRSNCEPSYFILQNASLFIMTINVYLCLIDVF